MNCTPKGNARKKTKAEGQPLPLWIIFILPIYAGGIFALILLPAAKDWCWLEAWAFIITFSLNLTISYSIINKKNPRVLRNRLKIKKVGVTDRIKKSAGSDKFILPFISLGFFGALILPALDFRFKWTSIPFGVEIVGLAVANAGEIIMNIAMLQNPYASKILDINQGQKLVDTGLYAHVRHPLYSGGILMAMALPIALGSWWGLIPAAVAALAILVRIKFEEEMLEKGMDGYADYRTRVQYKLLPGIF
ncbi:MAG: isoprenylcysteine carboxylmethyltransferase family protein [Anaerolineaceae bacterium]|nr:isoprenylcysteine carboxylmethyltransferase family protein [Anaerolineaceae bacterium]